MNRVSGEERLARLRAAVADLPPSTVESEAVVRVEEALAAAWDFLDGSPGGGMQGYKVIGRTEDMRWEPPFLRFRIERHGAVMMGSTRAEIQAWEVDLEGATASWEEAGVRQVRKPSARVTAKQIQRMARDVATAMRAGVEHPCVEWRRSGLVRVDASEVVKGDGLAAKETMTNRRGKLRTALESELEPHGWVETSPHFWRPPSEDA